METQRKEFAFALEALSRKRELVGYLQADYERERAARDLMIQSGKLSSDKALPVRLVYITPLLLNWVDLLTS